MPDNRRSTIEHDPSNGLIDQFPFRVCGSPILAPEILGGKTLWEPRNQRGCLVVMSDSYFSGYFHCRMPLESSKEPLCALFSLPWGLAQEACFYAALL
jgi:hypothetical protein